MCIRDRIRIHDMFVLLQQNGVALRIIERQIHVVGIVGEDISEMHLQGAGKLDIRLRGQLGRQLCGQVRHQLQLIVHLRLWSFLIAVAQIIINHRTAHNRLQEEKQEICLPKCIHQFSISSLMH